jgi:hypothetical protein
MEVTSMSKCKTVQDENKIEQITVKTRDGQIEIPKQVIPKAVKK